MHHLPYGITQVNVPCLDTSPYRPVLDLPTPEEWEAELTLVIRDG